MNSWLYLEAYIEITFNHKNKACMLLNILDSRKFLFYGSDYEIIYKIFKNEYSIKICSEIESKKMEPLINTFESNFIGGVIHSENKPLIMYPKINIQKDLRKFKKIPFRDQGYNILDNLLEISIHIDCKKETLTKKILQLLKFSEYGSLLRTNLIIENYCTNSIVIKELIDFFENNSIGIEFCIFINLIDFPLFNKDFGSIRTNSKFLLFIIINNYNFDHKILNEKNVKYVFKISNEKGFNIFNEVIKDKDIMYNFEIDIQNCKMDFLKDFVYLSKDDILDIEINKKNYDANKILNKNLFGKLIIKNNKIYNCESKGKLIAKLSENKELKDIIYDALIKTNEWFLTRNKVNPCKSCIFKNICPPISEYEISAKKYNFCNINTKIKYLVQKREA